MAELRSLLLLFFSCLGMRSLFSSHAETLIADMKQGQQLSDLASDHLVSDNGFYKLGFFSPGSVSDLGVTTNRFLGIWYSKLPNHPDAIWVGNPESPINDSSAVFMLDSDGKLKIVYDGGQTYLADVNQTASGNVTVSLLSTGNLVLREVDSKGAPGNVLWESFSNASNTLLPGMKVGRNLKTGENWTISSWLSDQSPVPGAFKLGLDPSGADQLIVWRREEVYWSSGVWENGEFQEAPELTKRNDLFWFTYVSNSEEKYFSYYLKNNLTLDQPENNTTKSRWELNSWGQILQSILSLNGSIWETTAISPCTFNPKYPDAVCIEEKASECRNESVLFVRTNGFLNGTESTYTDNSTIMELSDCHATCWSDCTCIGYEAVYKNGTGCRFYKKGAKFVQNDYFPVAYLLTIATKDGSTKKRWWIWCIVGLLVGLALLLASYLCYSYRRRKLGQTNTATVETSQEHRLLELRSQTTEIEEIYRLKIGKRRGQEFKMYSFSEIVAATNEFSFASKLGEGGFGPVYKGVLPDGQLNSWGQILQSILSLNGSIWETTAISPCTFNPKYPDAVCIEEKASECRNESVLFVRTNGFLNGTESTYTDNSTIMELSDCHATCWSDCTCIGYEAVYKNGTGCRFYKKGAKFVQNDYFPVAYLLTIATKDGSTKKRWWIWCIVGLLVGLALLLASYLCYSYRRRKLGQTNTATVETSQEHRLLELRSQTTEIEEIYRLKIGKRRGQEFKMYSFSEIVAATNEFSFASKLGEGGFGPVYKGVLPDGQQVAVKRLARQSGQGLNEFMNEITLIAELQHSNLVQLLGCCIQGEEKILIYEFMTNTSLDVFLFDSIRGKLLDWQTRVNIIEGIAQGLLYLHKYSRVRVIHRDLKPSNILLDKNMNPKISDFGMARIFTQNESRANTNRVVGTYGYMSPEYAMNGIFSEKSDVYSFGVLVLEIVSGKKNSMFVSSNALSLIEFAWKLWQEGDSRDLADTSMESCPKDQVSKFAHVGLLCVQEHAMDRPTMSEVISMLTNDIMFLPDPKQPAYGISRSEAGSSSLPDGRSDIDSLNAVSITVMDAR